MTDPATPAPAPAPGGVRGLAQALRRQRRAALPGDPPYTRGAPWLGVALDYGRDAGAFLGGLRAKHGHVFSVFLAGDRVTFVTDPRDYGTVLKARSLDFHTIANQIAAMAFGGALDDIEALDAGGIGRMAIDHLRGDALADLTRGFEDAFAQVALSGPLPAADDLYTLVAELVFPAAGIAVFGQGFDAEIARADFDRVDGAFPLLLAGVPALFLPGVGKARRSLATALAAGFAEAPLITVERLRLMQAESTPADTGAWQLSFLWAAQANTLPSVFWTLFHVLACDDARAAVTAEVRDALDAAPVDPATGRPRFDRETLKQLVRLDSAIDEALRLTAASLTIRVALEDTTLTLHDGSEVVIRQGERVGLFPWLMHHDPELYDDPDTFRCDRYLNPDGSKRSDFLWRGERIRTHLMPFGGGVSMCPGRHFARNEIKIAVALLLAHFD
ncbi:MAG: cytochrome P450, partial [Myxococcota bacterium]